MLSQENIEEHERLRLVSILHYIFTSKQQCSLFLGECKRTQTTLLGMYSSFYLHGNTYNNIHFSGEYKRIQTTYVGLPAAGVRKPTCVSEVGIARSGYDQLTL